MKSELRNDYSTLRCESIILKELLKNFTAQIKILSIISLNQMFVYHSFKMKLFEKEVFSLPCSTPILSTHSLIHYNHTLHSLLYPFQSGFCFHSTTELLIKITNDVSIAIANGHFQVFDDSSSIQHSWPDSPKTLFSLGFLLPLWPLFLKFLYWLFYH